MRNARLSEMVGLACKSEIQERCIVNVTSRVRVYPRVSHGFSHGYRYRYGYEIADPAKTRTHYGNSNCGATKYGCASRALHPCFLTFTIAAGP